jgi:hypothetical protein
LDSSATGLVVELLDLRQGVVHHVGFRLALVFRKVREELFFGLIRIRNEFGSRTEGQPANIAIGDAGRSPHKPYDLHIPLGHGNIMAAMFLAGQMRFSKFSRVI